jgi:hypothetical protein
MVFTGRANPVSYPSHLLAGMLRGGICMLAIAMLLSFPAVRPHSYLEHLRSPEVRRSVAQNTPLAPMHGDARVKPSVSKVEFAPEIRSQSAVQAQNREAEISARPCIFETLHRMKLRPRSDADAEAHL